MPNRLGVRMNLFEVAPELSDSRTDWAASAGTGPERSDDDLALRPGDL
jgi:hypothetical protein